MECTVVVTKTRGSLGGFLTLASNIGVYPTWQKQCEEGVDWTDFHSEVGLFRSRPGDREGFIPSTGRRANRLEREGFPKASSRGNVHVRSPLFSGFDSVLPSFPLSTPGTLARLPSYCQKQFVKLSVPPLLLVEKKDKSMRLCVDYRLLGDD
ncbi:hypothetical protein CR513_00410, partial [Mucuna pruriens]